MRTTAGASLLFAFVFMAGIGIAEAKPQAVEWKGKTYHVVTSTDTSMDTGNEVCAAVGKQCIGYTAFTTDICTSLHKYASKKSDASGSKAGFYCDGEPQGGVCATERSTCHICPTCEINADCSTEIGTLYREMYVECTPQDEKIQEPSKLMVLFNQIGVLPGRWWSTLRDTVVRSFDQYRDILSRLTVKQFKYGKVKVQGPKGEVEVDIPVDSLICEFYQNNKKMVTCGALGAADSFCIESFGSRFAKAELCQDDGVIVCSKPCTTNPQELKPQRCAFDGDRPRGNQAPPIDLCTETKTIKVDMGGLGKKKAGEVCAHGGECGTGICLGQPSDSGIKYFCSCKQNAHDYTCGK